MTETLLKLREFFSFAADAMAEGTQGEVEALPVILMITGIVLIVGYLKH